MLCMESGVVVWKGLLKVAVGCGTWGRVVVLEVLWVTWSVLLVYMVAGVLLLAYMVAGVLILAYMVAGVLLLGAIGDMVSVASVHGGRGTGTNRKAVASGQAGQALA